VVNTEDRVSKDSVKEDRASNHSVKEDRVKDSVKADVDNKEVEVVMDVTEQIDLKKGIKK